MTPTCKSMGITFRRGIERGLQPKMKVLKGMKPCHPFSELGVDLGSYYRQSNASQEHSCVSVGHHEVEMAISWYYKI